MTGRPPTFAEYRNRLQALGHAWFGGAWNPNLGGVRSRSRDAGGWDDWLILAFEDDAGRGNLHAYQGTTDPSDRWLTTTDRHAAGTAIVMPGQHRGCWAVGDDMLHAGKYPAFRQIAPMTFVRDNDGDAVLDIEALQVQSGVHGFNGHRAQRDGAAARVGLYSAGCQVWRLRPDFEHALAFVRWSSRWYGSRVSYTLLDEWR